MTNTHLESVLQSSKAWLLYDRDCGFCKRWVERFRPYLERHGYAFTALQSDWVREHYSALSEEELLKAMRVLERPRCRNEGDGGQHIDYAGGNALIHISRYIWWLWPVWLFGQVWPCSAMIRWVYRLVARNRMFFSKFS